jgi:hypothetical protein
VCHDIVKKAFEARSPAGMAGQTHMEPH